ncbi:E3 ubiquitin-protein ligase HECW1 [Microtus ochrogaster]|uniref:E3 ubiquitin-protein ligase HECW1 n=1 Tax=Microtus ochrogaster TaxID=79684 RepID=A0A8J6G6H7_MICOH|nr:E3 ubiquitin-protein ligase HECW1 [Microtus ochrogaster]
MLYVVSHIPPKGSSLGVDFLQQIFECLSGCDKSCWFLMTLSNISFLLQNLYQNRFLGLAAMASPSRNSQSRRRCKEPLRYSYNPDQFHNIDIRNCAHDGITIPRSTSDTDLVTSDSRSTLMVSSSYYSIGHSQDLVIHWDIKEEVDAGDWIGMYLIGEVSSENFLDYKNRGVNGSHRGQIIWKIDASSYFVESETKICFKYYHGVSGALRATTPSVTVKNSAAPIFKGIGSEETAQSQGSRRLISFSLSGCHHQELQTTNVTLWVSSRDTKVIIFLG